MSLMNVGISSLTANQQALTTTGHNIANANTAGYSRQTVSTTALVGQNTGSGYVGKGVQVSTVTRHYNELLGRQSNAASAASAADAIRYQSLMQMQDVYSGGDASLGAAINSMMNAFADVEAAPTDGTARNVVLTRMSELTARFRSASASLQEQEYATKQQLTNNAAQVNSLASQVATLNSQIARALATGHQPNDLLDARDQAIREINQYVQTSQVEADDGSISLFVGGSQPLVLGSSTGQLSVAETAEYPGSGKLSLYFSQPNGVRVELTANMVGGGEMAGLLKFNNDDLVTGRNLLGRLALSIGTELNQQNGLGLTLSGNYGGDLFLLTTQTRGWSNITGYDVGNPAASATATVTDTRSLVASDYKILFDGSNTAQLIRQSDGMITPLPIDPVNGIDAEVDGLQFTVPGNIATSATKGQSILFQPFNTAADEIQPLVHNPNDLAVASAVSANIDGSNTGTLQLSSLRATDVAGVPAQGAPVRITFDGAGNYSYQTYDPLTSNWSAASAAAPYSSGQAIQINGWNITLTGTPAAGDTVSVSNALDLGDGYKLNAGNASAFLDLRDAEIFDGGTTLSDGFSSAMAVIGTRTQSAKYAAELSETVANSLNADRTAVSGVNLDEEAARLLQYQQAYQASAKIIQTAQSLFDSLLNAVGP
ncbi:flagellar hook-associated protein FlgK [Comamonas aquatica]|uniref:Flagellar hook-associated protein 1 n=1 Tax=Comamonas aquatica TaxID=225991 RepID=A0AA43AXK2_9BURK|nr:flagellar hook-associated protein FlgK [Comamonas aquatica]MDH1427080.1 flagellar hook-associated protein FlgK [Comamonas aquatica]MDH1605547.1 flagellar hook-associated protein FlgK [Comamonas aquatica]MDH1617592.1 flagellar hook-associated protein FlgK [Comamonas aquatica]MDH2005561.1 flagellar hook-associated protein FlgK [Comamonas aquatica]